MSTVNVISGLRYEDANHMIEWLKRAFGFIEHAVYRNAEGDVEHAELMLGNGMIMIGSSKAKAKETTVHWYVSPREAKDLVTSSFYLVTADCRAAFERAQAAGAGVLLPLEEKSYGGSGFTVRDPEGQIWSVGDYDPMAKR